MEKAVRNDGLFYLSQLQKEIRRSIAGALDDRYVVDYQEEEVAIR